MTLRTDRREWDDLAQRDAMWAVVSEPHRRGCWDVDEFMATGRAEVGGILAGLQEQGLFPGQTRRALDFGCGLGRLTAALADHFSEVIGVDISDEMVRRAEALHASRPTCRFVANHTPSLAFVEDSSCDLVLSLIALQHVSSSAAILDYIREFARAVAPDGAVVFQLPTSVGWRVRLHPLRALNHLVRSLPRAPDRLLKFLTPYSMSLVGVSEATVRRTLADAGCQVVAAFPDKRTGSAVVPSLSYVAVRA